MKWQMTGMKANCDFCQSWVGQTEPWPVTQFKSMQEDKSLEKKPRNEHY